MPEPLIAELIEELDARATPDPRRQIEVHVDMRYVGQEHTLTIVLDDDADAVRTRFSEEYRRAFGAVLDEELEIVTYRVIATTPLRDDANARMAAATATRRAERRHQQRDRRLVLHQGRAHRVPDQGPRRAARPATRSPAPRS